MSYDMIAPGIGSFKTSAQQASNYSAARLGAKISVVMSARCRFSAIFCGVTTQATTALTDIVAWDLAATGEVLCNVTADTSAYQNYIVGLPITYSLGTAAIPLAAQCWVQTSGNLIVTADGTQIGNGLLGDGSVGAGETMMAHASTDGMVDTWATNAGYDIGRCMEADAPAIQIFVLSCAAAGAFA